MSFLNPLFLFGLAAASIPILIHLFTRQRPRETRFPSLEFLAEVNRSEIRRLKLRQWLLLLLRTPAVAALAPAMSRPALKGHLCPARRRAVRPAWRGPPPGARRPGRGIGRASTSCPSPRPTAPTSGSPTRRSRRARPAPHSASRPWRTAPGRAI